MRINAQAKATLGSVQNHHAHVPTTNNRSMSATEFTSFAAAAYAGTYIL